MVLITIVMGVYKPTYNWGAPHCIEIRIRLKFTKGRHGKVAVLLQFVDSFLVGTGFINLFNLFPCTHFWWIDEYTDYCNSNVGSSKLGTVSKLKMVTTWRIWGTPMTPWPRKPPWMTHVFSAYHRGLLRSRIPMWLIRRRFWQVEPWGSVTAWWWDFIWNGQKQKEGSGRIWFNTKPRFNSNIF